MSGAERNDATAPFGVPVHNIVGARSAFESAWRAGRRPQIESFVNQAAAHERARMLQELLALELELRRQAGENPQPDEYFRRFPGDNETLSLYFGHSGDLTRLGDVDYVDANGTIAPAEFFRKTGQLSDGVDFGDYELFGLLGRGGMGEVYRARQKSVDRIVALKVIRPDCLPGVPASGQSHLLRRFHAEAHAAAQLEHENIVAVYEVGEHSGRNFYAMRYVEGRSLTDIINSQPLPPRKAAEYMEPVARAVAYAHAKGILHRDIKPRNILVDAVDKPYVADFGLAKEIREVSELTKSGEVLGTPSYIAPEQARDSSHVGPAADIYSIGATLYHLVTGRPPFQATEPVETLRQVLSEDPIPPSRLNRGVDRDLETICLKCLEKEPGRRYATADLLADDLHHYLANEPIMARPLGRLDRGWRWYRRNKLVALLILGIGCSLAATAVMSTVAYVRARNNLIIAQNAEKNERELRLKALVQMELAESEKKRAEAEKQRAEAGFSKAYTTANKFLFDFDRGIYTSPTLRDLPEMQKLRHRLLYEAAQNYREMLVEKPDDDNIMADLAETMVRLCDVNSQLGNQREAVQGLDEVLAIRKKMRELHPTSPRYRRELALICLDRSEMQIGRKQFADAVESAAMAKDLLEEQLADPTARSWAVSAGLLERQLEADLLDALDFLGLAQQGANRLADFEATLQRGLQVAKEAIKRFPKSLGFRFGEANRMLQLGRLMAATGRKPQSTEFFDLALGRWKEMIEKAEPKLPKNLDEVANYVNQFAASLRNMANLYEERGQWAEAANSGRMLVDRLQTVREQMPNNAEYRTKLVDALVSLNRVLCRGDRIDDAIGVAHKHRELIVSSKRGVDFFRNACDFARCADVLAKRKDPTAKETEQRKACEGLALKCLQLAVERGYNNRQETASRPELQVLKQRAEFQSLLDLMASPRPAAK